MKLCYVFFVQVGCGQDVVMHTGLSDSSKSDADSSDTVITCFID